MKSTHFTINHVHVVHLAVTILFFLRQPKLYFRQCYLYHLYDLLHCSWPHSGVLVRTNLHTLIHIQDSWIGSVREIESVKFEQINEKCNFKNTFVPSWTNDGVSSNSPKYIGFVISTHSFSRACENGWQILRFLHLNDSWLLKSLQRNETHLFYLKI